MSKARSAYKGKYASRYKYVKKVRSEAHAFSRRFDWANINGNAGYIPFTNASTFTFNQLPNIGDFISLFDRYKITYIKLYIWLKIDPSAQTAATASYPKLYWVKDYDDASTPATLNEIREHQSCKVAVMHPNRPIVIRLKPSTLSLTYRSALASTYTPRWNQWVDMANTDVPHYGLKLAI
ncbi:MAG: hypothetical protein H7836_17345, partial [Magnetococcus sp. YQC-3]